MIILTVVVQLLTHVRLFVTPLSAALQWMIESFTIYWSLSKPMSIELEMPSNHLILCHCLLLLPSIFPSDPWIYKERQPYSCFTSGVALSTVIIVGLSLVARHNRCGWRVLATADWCVGIGGWSTFHNQCLYSTYHMLDVLLREQDQWKTCPHGASLVLGRARQ